MVGDLAETMGSWLQPGPALATGATGGVQSWTENRSSFSPSLLLSFSDIQINKTIQKCWAATLLT